MASVPGNTAPRIEAANDAPQGLETAREPEAASGADTGARGANGGKSKPSGARSGSLIDAAAEPVMMYANG